MIYAYILKSLKDGGYYVGISKNVVERLRKHNSGSVRSTKSRRPFEVVLSEQYDSYTSARAREKELKAYKGGVQLKELVK